MPHSAMAHSHRGLVSPPALSKYYNATTSFLPRIRLSNSGAWTAKYIAPLGCVSLLTVMSVIIYTSRYAVKIQSSEAESAQSAELSATIQQLKGGRAQAVQLFQGAKEFTGNSSRAGQLALQPPRVAQQQQAVQVQQAPAAAADVPAAMAAIPGLTKLHNAILRSSKDFKQHRAVMKQQLGKLVHLEASQAQQEVEQQLKQQHDPMTQFVLELYQLMLASGKLLPCREDTTLVTGDAVQWPSSSSSGSSSSSSANQTASEPITTAGSSPKYFFASNLRDNSVHMPHFTLSLLQTLLRLPQDAAFVSVYESNSDDGAHGWIDVMQLALNVIGTPNRLVARGMLVRTEGQHRIEFLAQVRNMALAPLYSHYAQAKHSHTATAGSSSSSSSSSRSGGGPDSSDGLPAGSLPWDPNYVVFINDVYFCWSMVLRLMNYRADVTCGMDFWQNPDATAALPWELRSKAHQAKPSIPAEYRLESPVSDKDAMSPDQQNPIVFYDVWVSRDLAGSKMWWTYPFILDTDSSHVVQTGLPVRASCCWNGLVVLAAEPFRKGVRFRMHREGECRASECTLVCEDFARLGFERVVVDAGVQVAYDWHLAREMMAVGVEGVGQSTWVQVKAAGIAEARRRPDYGSMECCSLQPKAKWVQFYSDCSRTDIMARNHTDDAFRANLWR